MRRTAFLLLCVALSSAAIAVWLFPRALPLLDLEGRISRESALAVADSFLSEHGLAAASSRRAILFASDDSLRTFVELGGGGKDTLDALLRGQDVALYRWSVRAFMPGEVDETQVRLSADGRVIGFRRTLPDSLSRPDPGDPAAETLARSVLTSWLREPAVRWTLATVSYRSITPGDRTDRIFTFERADRRIADAPLRLEIVIAGDLPVEARPYVDIPEAFERRYEEMRAANDLLALLATLGLAGLMILAVVALRRYAAARGVRWREPGIIGGIVGAFGTAAALNAMPLTWSIYDTATSEGVHLAIGLMAALASGAFTALLVGITLAAAEALTRHAFPWHVDWWQLWRHRGTREVAGQVGGGYVAAAMGFAYIAAFYVVARTWLGWWVPSELLDDPNQIATRLPWVAGIAASLQAAIWEESLFRAVPLAAIAIWARDRDDRERWMALGVVATAIVFGFAHSNYASWPPYSRGVEIFLEACFWAFLYLRFGLLVPVLAHFTYDVILFGLFATGGDAAAYRITAGIVVLVMAAPGLAVLAAWLRQGGWRPLPDEARFGAWQPAPVPAASAPSHAPVRASTGPRARTIAVGMALVATVGVIADRRDEVTGPRFTVARADAESVADSMLRARGEDPATWRRLTNVRIDSALSFRAFLTAQDAESLVTVLAASYAIPTWWQVRYVHTTGSVSERAEEWEARVLPDGRPLDVRRIVPDEAPGAELEPDSARTRAAAALVVIGADLTHLEESEYEVEPRPARRDVTISWVDTSVALPADARAMARVHLAGDEVTSVSRFIDLPEAFERAYRNRLQSSLVGAGLFAMVACGLVIWAILRTIRRLPVRSEPLGSNLGRRLLALFTVVAMLAALQSVPASLATWDTSQPWESFLGSVWATQFLALAGVLVIAVLWLLANALRRRLGIPVVRRDSSGGPWSDDFVLGVGLGAVLPLIQVLGALVPAEAMAPVPSTTLASALPILGALPELVAGPASLVPAVAIPALAVAGAARQPGTRLAFAVVLMVLAGGMLASMQATAGGLDAATIIRGGATAVGVVLALRAWGAMSLASWVVAALFLQLTGALGRAVHAPTAVERLAALLALVVGSAILLALRSWMARQAAQSPVMPEAPVA